MPSKNKHKRGVGVTHTMQTIVGVGPRPARLQLCCIKGGYFVCVQTQRSCTNDSVFLADDGGIGECFARDGGTTAGGFFFAKRPDFIGTQDDFDGKTRPQIRC